jgi:dTDP-4-amino-4,6-dideoxygalactose transaminase
VTTTSFFPSKPLGCYGDGGAVLTDDDEVAGLLRSFRVHGQGSSKYDNVRVGINGRLDTLQAAVLLQKLTVFEEELHARGRVAARYSEALTGFVSTPVLADACSSAWAQYTIRIEGRDRCAAALAEREIPTAVYYALGLHQQPAYCSFPQGPAANEVSEDHSRHVLSLPMHPYLTEDQQDLVIGAVVDFQRGSEQWN